MQLRTGYELVRDAASAWSEDKAPRLGAALAYYSVFSLAPLLVIAIAIAGFVFGTAAAERQVVTTLDGLVGPTGARAIHQLLENANQPGQGLMATIFGVGTLLLGASGLFGQLKDALNTVWGVAPKPGTSLWGTVRERFFSITLVLGTGFLLLVSLVLSALISAAAAYFSHLLPGNEGLWQAVNQGVAFTATAGIFALMFHYLPDAEVAWRDVWVGALITAGLFTVGKYALGVYLGNSSVTSPFGAAGSLVIVLLWVYYSAQIMLFGAELTKVYANRCGSRIRPDADAMRLSEHARMRQGITFVADGADATARGIAPLGDPQGSPDRRS